MVRFSWLSAHHCPERPDSIIEGDVLAGEEPGVFGNCTPGSEGTTWLPGRGLYICTIPAGANCFRANSRNFALRRGASRRNAPLVRLGRRVSAVRVGIRPDDPSWFVASSTPGDRSGRCNRALQSGASPQSPGHEGQSSATGGAVCEQESRSECARDFQRKACLGTYTRMFRRTPSRICGRARETDGGVLIACEVWDLSS